MTMFMFFVDLKRVQSLRDVDVNTQRNEGLGGPTNLDGAGPTQRSVFHQGSKKCDSKVVECFIPFHESRLKIVVRLVIFRLVTFLLPFSGFLAFVKISRWGTGQRGI